MRPQKQLKVNLEDLVVEMTSGDAFDGQPVYLDTVTGEIVYVPQEEAETFEPEEHHAPILRVEGRDQYQVMTRFTALETDPETAALLRFALHGKGAFRRFRDAVRTDRELEKRWYAYEAEAGRARAVEWLNSIGIDPLDTTPPRIPTPVSVPVPPAITLVDLLVLGAPGGKPELIGDQVERVFVARSADDARRTFRALAREIAQLCDVPWRRAMIEGKSMFELERFHLRLDETRIELAIATPMETWRKFS